MRQGEKIPFHIWLGQLRRARGLSQDGLGKKVGISQQKISQLERGLRPTNSEIERLVKVFELQGNE